MERYSDGEGEEARTWRSTNRTRCSVFGASPLGLLLGDEPPDVDVIDASDRYRLEGGRDVHSECALVVTLPNRVNFKLEPRCPL